MAYALLCRTPAPSFLHNVLWIPKSLGPAATQAYIIVIMLMILFSPRHGLGTRFRSQVDQASLPRQNFDTRSASSCGLAAAQPQPMIVVQSSRLWTVSDLPGLGDLGRLVQVKPGYASIKLCWAAEPPGYSQWIIGWPVGYSKCAVDSVNNGNSSSESALAGSAYGPVTAG